MDGPSWPSSFWSRCAGLNRGPAVYETAALPLSYIGEESGRVLDERCRDGKRGRHGGGSAERSEKTDQPAPQLPRVAGRDPRGLCHQQVAQNRVRKIAVVEHAANRSGCIGARRFTRRCVGGSRRFAWVRVGAIPLIRLTKPLLYH